MYIKQLGRKCVERFLSFSHVISKSNTESNMAAVSIATERLKEEKNHYILNIFVT